MPADDAYGVVASRDGLITERLHGELLVYDTERDEVHCLHAEAAAVFDLVDGTRTAAEIAAVASEHLSKPLDPARVKQVLAELDAHHLLADGETEGEGLSRRQLIQKGALTGATVAGATLITSMAAPFPAAAQSPPGGCEGQPCGSLQTCGGSETCHCYQTAEGGGACGQDIGCPEETCTASGDCPTGSFCAPNTCCGAAGICIPLCGTVARASRLQRGGRTTARR